jgi:hypothetical protein
MVRSSDLTGKEAVALYDATAFNLWKNGQIFNVHITILWSTLKIENPQQATRLLGQFLNRCSKWARVGTAGTDRLRRRARTGHGFVFRWVYVCEYNSPNNFHSHVLAYVPREVLPEFKAWTRSILRRLAKHYGNETTVKIIASQERDESGAVQRCFMWYRYCQRRKDFAAAGRSKSAAGTQARRPPISGAFLLAAFHS